MTVQTEEGSYRSVCFSAEKHPQLLSKYESSSPVKLTRFQVKKNCRTNEDEIHINKRCKIEDPLESEVNFDMKDLEIPDTPECTPGFTSVQNLITGDVNLANVCGRITLQGSVETVMSKNKTLHKHEALFTDNSGTIRLVLWENDIARINNKSTYQISKVVVKQYESAKYITLNKSSTIQLSDASINREDTPLKHTANKTVMFPADGVMSFQRYICCSKCQTKLVSTSCSLITKCAGCGLTQLKSKCPNCSMANVLFHTTTESISLHLFDDKLRTLFKLYKDQNTAIEHSTFEELSDDDVLQFLLTVQATVYYNSRKNIVDIRKTV